MLMKLFANWPWTRRNYIGRHRAVPRYFGDVEGIDTVAQLLGAVGRDKR
ncbi:hypothetical protein LX16_2876 [Stackebrandtia albiflava]|uniref:Uncharacterized protein n=1 Tax=Stackebrandtia albiflava TaxID=406432 RepID=A0A562V2L3_9ACTN|nr:hypothetical protein [Stackebrandtia albiflava]TWJ12126.1 hypothetical protein LX16_2876 [Stackebrandtia albiflava]